MTSSHCETFTLPETNSSLAGTSTIFDGIYQDFRKDEIFMGDAVSFREGTVLPPKIMSPLFVGNPTNPSQTSTAHTFTFPPPGCALSSWLQRNPVLDGASAHDVCANGALGMGLFGFVGPDTSDPNGKR